MSENPLIIVNGNSGSGKRTVSKFLEERLDNYQRFSPDDTRRELGKEDYDPRDIDEVFLKMHSEMKETLENGNSIIVHSHYKTRKGRQMFYDIASAYDIPVLLIECDCPEDIAKERMIKRPAKDKLHCPPTDPVVYDRLAAILEDEAKDFDDNQNNHVSWIKYESVNSTVEEKLIRDNLKEFTSQISELLPYVNTK